MSLCVAWRFGEQICIATDSCISIDNAAPTYCGIKVLQIPVRVISPIDQESRGFETLFDGVYGLCFSGRFLAAYVIKESISEILLNLQFIGSKSDITFPALCEVVFNCYRRVLNELDGLDADFILVGRCPSNGKNMAAKFFCDEGGNLRWCEILLERPFSFDVIGAGEARFRNLFPQLRTLEPRVNYAVFDAIDQIITSGGVASVGGGIQYGEVEPGGNFRLRGTVDYGSSGGCFEVRHLFRGMDLRGLWREEKIFGFHIKYSFVDPLEKKKYRILRTLGIDSCNGK